MSEKRVYGREPAPDLRDKKHKITRKRSQRRYKSWSTMGYHSDQGRTSSCVGHGWSHWLHAAPIRQWMNPYGIYELAQYFDEWEGVGYQGTSVRGAAKVLSKLGAIGGYEWAWDAATVGTHILEVGPVVIGVDWYEGMNNPDSYGYVRLTGRSLGGHCVLLSGYNGDRGMFKIKNSYGTSWGRKGYAYLAEADLDRLLKAGGEACCGTEVKLVA